MARWANSFKGFFPDDLAKATRYYNFKIPVLATMVEGKQATDAIRRQCVQHLIDACQHLIDARPDDAPDCKVVASISLPDMFSSEVCIYTDSDYHRVHTQPSSDQYGCSRRITDHDPTEQWGLTLPAGMQCVGLSFECQGIEGIQDGFIGQRWHFGEVLPQPDQP